MIHIDKYKITTVNIQLKKAECRRIDAFEDVGVGEDSQESLGLQRDKTSQP